MLNVLAGDCPATMPLVTNGPFPWQCIPVWNRACARANQVHPGSCFTETFGPASWWTPLHIACVAVLAVSLAILLGFALAAIRDRSRNRRFLRGAA